MKLIIRKLVKSLRNCEYNEAGYQLLIDLKKVWNSVRGNPI